jgi:hypothetical protein
MMNEMNTDLKDKVDEMINDFYWNFRNDVNDEGGRQLAVIMERLRKEIPPIMEYHDTDDSRYTKPWQQNWHGKYTDEEQGLPSAEDLSDVNYTGDESVHDLAKIEPQELI